MFYMFRVEINKDKIATAWFDVEPIKMNGTRNKLPNRTIIGNGKLVQYEFETKGEAGKMLRKIKLNKPIPELNLKESTSSLKTFKEFNESKALPKSKIKDIIDQLLKYYINNQGMYFGKPVDESPYNWNGSSFISFLGTQKTELPFLSVDEGTNTITVTLGFYKSTVKGNKLTFDKTTPIEKIVRECELKLDIDIRREIYMRNTTKKSYNPK